MSLLLYAFHLLSRKNLSISGMNSPRLLVLCIQELKTPKVEGKKKKKRKRFFSFGLTVIKKKVNQIA